VALATAEAADQRLAFVLLALLPGIFRLQLALPVALPSPSPRQLTTATAGQLPCSVSKSNQFHDRSDAYKFRQITMINNS
jgi:hypothetical protein